MSMATSTPTTICNNMPDSPLGDTTTIRDETHPAL
jgi:hypothetical protein